MGAEEMAKIGVFVMCHLMGGLYFEGEKDPKIAMCLLRGGHDFLLSGRKWCENGGPRREVPPEGGRRAKTGG